MHHDFGIFWILAILGSLIFIVVTIFYCFSLFSAMRRIPRDKRQFPAWFIWLFLIPFVRIIFEWIMVPFGIPNSFKNALSDNPQAVHRAHTLFGIGLAMMICVCLSWIPYLNIVTGIAAFVLWIIYWVKIVKFKNEFLMNFPIE